MERLACFEFDPMAKFPNVVTWPNGLGAVGRGLRPVVPGLLAPRIPVRASTIPLGSEGRSVMHTGTISEAGPERGRGAQISRGAPPR